jgi:hypothetical protein
VACGITGEAGAGETLSLPLPPKDGAAEHVSFLDRPVGYKTMRWAIVPLGALVGPIVGLIVAELTIAPDPPETPRELRPTSRGYGGIHFGRC